MDPQTKIQITERALTQRINRKLKPEYKHLSVARSFIMFQTYGHYCVVDLFRNQVEWAGRDLSDVAQFGRDLGVLRPWEEMTA